jgi:starch synthase
MKILLASSELHPYSKTGGLADMAGALAKSLAHAGHRVGVVTPLYRGILEKFPGLKKMDWHMDLPLGPRFVHAEVWTLEPVPGLTIYFIHQTDFYQRNGLYGEAGADYADNAERFIFFSKAAMHLARYLPWQPEIVHAHDWQTGLLPLLIQHERLQAGWLKVPRTCFTIHNLAYQGIFPAAQYPLTNLPLDYFNINGAEFYGKMNCLKAGIAFTDAITTVSPRYAREITTPELGCGLDDLLRRRQSSLFGILNGVDYEEWNTTKNPHLPFPYSVRNLAGKTKDKLSLQKEIGLPVNAEVPLFGTITRLAEQKGLDIELAALEEMLSTDMQFTLLGSGSPVFEKAYRELARRYPQKAAVRIGFDQGLSHRIEAGCDFYIMPSKFEPCGLNQMYSLRYGTVPLVRVTGGLDDTVVDISEEPELADGIKFTEYSGRALARALRKALVLYQEPKLLLEYRRNGMNADFSWDRMVQKYIEVYQKS